MKPISNRTRVISKTKNKRRRRRKNCRQKEKAIDNGMKKNANRLTLKKIMQKRGKVRSDLLHTN